MLVSVIIKLKVSKFFKFYILRFNENYHSEIEEGPPRTSLTKIGMRFKLKFLIKKIFRSQIFQSHQHNMDLISHEDENRTREITLEYLNFLDDSVCFTEFSVSFLVLDLSKISADSKCSIR